MSTSITCDPSSSSLCSQCFHEWTDGATNPWPDKAKATQTSSYNGVVTCSNTEQGIAAPRCSGYSRADEFGQFCRSQCANLNNCIAQLQTYCDTYSGNADCRCLQPDGSVYGSGHDTVSYDALRQFVQSNPLNMDPRCLYAACRPGSTSIIYQPSLANTCPNNTSVFCSVTNVSITLTDVRARNLNIMSQNCGTVAGAQGTGASSTQNRAGTVAGLSSHQLMVYGGVLAAVIVGGGCLRCTWH